MFDLNRSRGFLMGCRKAEALCRGTSSRSGSPTLASRRDCGMIRRRYDSNLLAAAGVLDDDNNLVGQIRRVVPEVLARQGLIVHAVRR